MKTKEVKIVFTFEINLGDILNTLISLVFGAAITLWIIERTKTKEKRKIMLDILRKEVNAYSDLDVLINAKESVIGMPQRNHIFMTLLSSDVLDIKKDKELIFLLHQMTGWVENYNSMNNIANFGILLESCVPHFNEARNVLNIKSRKHLNELKSLLENYN